MVPSVGDHTRIRKRPRIVRLTLPQVPRHLEANTATVLLNLGLQKLAGGCVKILLVEKVIDARRKIDVFTEPASEQSRVDYSERRNRGACEKLDWASILCVQAHKRFSSPKGLAQIKFHKATRRIAQELVRCPVLRLLEAVTCTSFQATRGLALDFQFHTSRFGSFEIPENGFIVAGIFRGNQVTD